MAIQSTNSTTHASEQNDKKTTKEQKSNNTFSFMLNNVQESMKKIDHNHSDKLKLDEKDYMTDEQFNDLVKTIDLQNISREDRELFKSIIEDQYITNEEVKNLSYKQLETLGKFIFVKEGKDNYIEETLINCDLKAGTLLSIPLISDDTNFKKALIQIVEKMDSDGEIAMFMQPLTGNNNSSKIVAFPDLLNFNYTGKNMGEVLENLIEDYKIKLNNSIKANEMEFYQNKIAMYTNLFNLYSEISGKDDEVLEKEEYVIDIRQDLINDLLSLLKTGLTISEIEDLETLINDINKLIDDSEKKEVSKKKIEEMIKELELKLEELQRRMGGKGEIEVEKDLETENSENLTHTMQEFKSMVLSLKNALDEIKEKKENNKNTNTDEELRLLEKLKNFRN